VLSGRFRGLPDSRFDRLGSALHLRYL